MTTNLMSQKLAIVFATIAILPVANVVVAQRFAAPFYDEHQDLSYYLRADGTRLAVRTAGDWQQRRQHILHGMEAVMGSLPRPERLVPLDVEVLEEHHGEGFVR